MDPARTETRLGDCEAAALLAEQLVLGHAHVLPQCLTVAAAFGMTEDRQTAAHGNAGRVHRHEDHRLAVVRVGVGIGDAHEHRELAAGVERAAPEPLTAAHSTAAAAPC